MPSIRYLARHLHAQSHHSPQGSPDTKRRLPRRPGAVEFSPTIPIQPVRKTDCPGVHWKNSFPTTGRFDVVDIVEAEDPKQIAKAAMIIRSYGHSTTETLFATPRKEFLAML